MPVVVRDLPQFLDAGRARVEKSLAGAVKHGKMDQAKHDEARPASMGGATTRPRISAASAQSCGAQASI